MNKKTMATGTLALLLLAMLAAPAAADMTPGFYVCPVELGGYSADYVRDENGVKLVGDGSMQPGPDDLIQVIWDKSADGITPPDPSDPSRCINYTDDVIWDIFVMGETSEMDGCFYDVTYLPTFPDGGPFGNGTEMIYFRAWNAPTVDNATHQDIKGMLVGQGPVDYFLLHVDVDPNATWWTNQSKPTPPPPETSFVISGYVFRSDGNPCNNPVVQITNGGSWTATTSAQSNYYRLMLDSGDVSVNDTLHLDASGCGQSKSVTHPVTQDEIDDGGIFNFNLTLPTTTSLAEGWNLVSLSLTPYNNSTAAVLDSIAGNYSDVMRYDTSTHSFVALSGTDEMENGVGYFIYMTAADTWSYDGDAYEEMDIELSLGLNCIGWVNSDVSLPSALDSIAGNYRYVARWDASERKYEVYLPGAPDVFNDFATMERGEGYFIAATTSCTLTYPAT